MLAGSADTAAEALAELGEAALECKLDGARMQVHKSGDDVRVFSRRLNDVTPAVPELVDAVRALPARELILDGEAIALRPDGRRTRSRPRCDASAGGSTWSACARAAAHAVPLRPAVLDGSPLLDEPLVRRAARAGRLRAGRAHRAAARQPPAEEAEAFFADAFARGHEGIMAKALDAPYEAGAGRGAGSRSSRRTLDLVVLAAEWGHGRRQGWLSNLHLGARDPAAAAS